MKAPQVGSDVFPRLACRIGLMDLYAKQLEISMSSDRVSRDSLGRSFYD